MELLKDRLKGTNYGDMDEFKTAVRKAWWDIPKKDIKSCIGSVWRRLRAVAQAQGGYIPY